MLDAASKAETGTADTAPEPPAHAALTDDPSLKDFFARIPATVAASFTDEQLAAISKGIGAHWQSEHLIDKRFSISLLKRRFYVVFITGEERRSRRRKRRYSKRQVHPIASLVSTALTLVSVTVLLLTTFGVFYLVTILIGSDAQSGGFWSSLWDQFRLLFH